MIRGVGVLEGGGKNEGGVSETAVTGGRRRDGSDSEVGGGRGALNENAGI